MISVRTVLVILAAAFTVYLAGRGLWWTEPVPYPEVLVLTLLTYLATTLLCIFWEQPLRGRRVGTPTPDDIDVASLRRQVQKLPVWASVLALTVSVAVPSAMAIAVGPDARTAGFATWYLGGIGALMTIVMVRRRPWVAWAGMLALTVGSVVWMGPIDALVLGLVGSLVWVGVAQLFQRSFDRAADDTARLALLQRAASAWQAAQVVRQRERRVQVQRALTVAGPVLTRAVSTGGVLTDAEKLEARIAEGCLRDEMRAPRLLDDDVREELARARRRGAVVTVLDEGGLDDLSEESLALIRAQLAEALRAAASERIFIRTSPHERIAVTIVGRSASTVASGEGGPADEDTVDLWREIPHPEAVAAERR